MKKEWTKPTITSIAIKKITLTGSASGTEGTGVGNAYKRN